MDFWHEAKAHTKNIKLVIDFYSYKKEGFP